MAKLRRPVGPNFALIAPGWLLGLAFGLRGDGIERRSRPAFSVTMLPIGTFSDTAAVTDDVRLRVQITLRRRPALTENAPETDLRPSKWRAI